MKLPIEIDRRQRLIATLALSAIDLPQPAREMANQLIAAAKITPGVTMDEVPTMDGRGRRRCLMRIRDLVDEMLEEIDAPKPIATT